MKYYLLCIASLLSASAAIAQPTFPVREIKPERRRPQSPVEVELASETKIGVQGRRTTSISVPNSAIMYTWSGGTKKWTQAPTLSRYTYDNKGQVQQVIGSDSATAQLQFRGSYLYNANGSLASYLSETWTGRAWEKANRTTYTYDVSGYQKEYLLQEWINDAWQNKERFTYSRDTHDNTTAYINQKWESGTWITTSGYMVEYTYNPDGKKASETGKQWERGANNFVYGGRNLYIYNAAGGMIEDTYESWDITSRSFVPRYRYVYTIQGTQPWSEYVYQFWSNGAYLSGSRTTNVTRDMQKRLTYYENQQWNNVISAWQADERRTITRQATGSYQEIGERLVDNKWVQYGRHTVIFDDRYRVIESKSETNDNGKWTVSDAARTLVSYDAAGNEMRIAQQYWGPSDTEYGNIILVTYGNYQTITLANKQAVALTAATQIYPNPTSDKANLQLASVPQGQGALQAQLLNALGQVVKQFTLKPQQGTINQELDLSNLKAGVYTLRIQTSEGAVAKQIVRQ